VEEALRFVVSAVKESVSIAMGYRLDCWGLILGSTPLLSSGYWGQFPQAKSGQGMKLTSPFHLVLRIRIFE
jgi:hypothetical protein